MPKIDDIRPRKSEGIDKFNNFDSQSGQKQFFGSGTRKNPERVEFFQEDIDRFSDRNLKKSIRHQRIKFELNYSYKTLFTSMLVCFLIVFSLARMMIAKDHTEKFSAEARDHLEQSFTYIENGNMDEAIKEADEAKKDINKLKLLAQSWGQDIQYLRFASASNSKLLASERLLDASYDIITTLSSIHNELTKVSLAGGGTASGSNIVFNIADSQKMLISAIKDGKNKLSKGRDELLLAKKGLPSDQAAEVDSAVSAIDNALQSIDSYQIILEKDLTWLSGADGGEKNILILFQNNSELRGGSGGSLGSFGVAKFKDGSLTGVDFGTNIYKIDQDFRSKTKISVPDQLSWLVPENGLTMKDSGFDVDGPKAMERIMWFYNQETGNRVDGVIMVDNTAFTSLLKEVGPIEVTEMNKTINADNFKTEVEYEVHQGYFDRAGGKEENEPKKILALMMPKFLDKLFSSLKEPAASGGIFSSFSKSLKQKDITLYFTNNEFEKRLTSFNYSANVFPTVGDYVCINNSNLDGAKSSLSMEENIKLSSTISSEGKVSDSLNLVRNHNGLNEWPDGINKNFVRLLLPENSNIVNFSPKEGYFEQMLDRGLKDNKPFWLTDDYGKKIVNFWMSTKPKEKSEADIQYEPSYTVDTKNDFNYIITFQKQPGAPSGNVEFKLNYPEGFEPQNVKNFDNVGRKIIIKLNLDQDRTINIKFKKIN
ncbi:MAG: DUF4012 domain-containing protein [Patescibacteria group bacterium]|nr:DUF4012 domain-containing protein [Patescibacteria group bacterium]